jgi:hypothetical protein
MSGLFDSAFWASWYITYTLQFLITSILITIVGSTTVYKYSSKPIIFAYFWFFGIAMTSFGVWVSTAFSKAKIAGTAAYVVIFGAYVPDFVVGSNPGAATAYPRTVLQSCGLLPPTAFGLGGQQIALFEGYQLGITQTTQYQLAFNYAFVDTIALLLGTRTVALALLRSQLPPDPPAVPVLCLCCACVVAVDIVLYAFLGWYFDKVIPSDYGTHLKPWFCFTRSYWSTTIATAHPHQPRPRQDPRLLADHLHTVSPFSSFRFCSARWVCVTCRIAGRDDSEESASLVADGESAPLSKDSEEPVAEELKKNCTVEIKGMRKVYDDGNVAVKGMHLNMYAGQIFCLVTGSSRAHVLPAQSVCGLCSALCCGD